MSLPAFDPRPWPLVVLMLAGLFGVYFALRPGEGQQQKATQPATTTSKPATGRVDAGLLRLAAAVVAPAIPDAKETLEQGVTLRFAQRGRMDARPARVLSLRVPEGTPPTPFLSAGDDWTATFTGFINLRLRSEYSFSALGRGKLIVKVGGQVVLETSGEDFDGKTSAAIKMEKGKNPIEVVYTPPAAGDAWVRVLWQSREFPPEPVQPSVLSHDLSEKSLREGIRDRDGREMIANLRCTQCHPLPKAQLPAGATVMPELATDAPDLSGAGARLKQGWMAAWIADPHALRADASMPRLHGAKDNAPDLAAYLATLGKPAGQQAKEPDDEAATQGSQLFAALGCIGCHTKPDADEVDKARVPLKFVNAKFQPAALRAWLLNPREHYPWTRMPDFHLTEFEADRLVAYLSKNAKGEISDNGKGDPAKGKALFASAGCANCHRMKEIPVAPAKSMTDLVSGSDWTKGCLAKDETSRGNAPDFALSDDQRASLQAFAAAGLSSLTNDVLPEFAERSVRHLQCTACHARDEVEDRWSNVSEEVQDLMPPETNIDSDQGDDATAGPRLFMPRGLAKLHAGDRIVISGDQGRPPLTWTGEKLRPQWMEQFIAGKIPYKPRYWLRSRMPAFIEPRAKGIAQGLALEHGFPPVAPPAPSAPKEDLAQIGQKLAGRDGGFACITCHSIVDTRAISPFEAPAPNFVHVTERLNHDYYVRWMRKPMRFCPGTKMPQFSEEGKSTIKEILNGEADRQFDAIWNYMSQGERITAPE
ncbi:MAG TPA: hypothetical protein VH475_05270 [Tepidisphaeraceae bacterium]|jgi:mono/diheme cytochrome c family protein